MSEQAAVIGIIFLSLFDLQNLVNLLDGTFVKLNCTRFAP